MLIGRRSFNSGLWVGWFQTLFREKVKSQSIGNLTLKSESASKIMPACEIWVLDCMCKCLFFQNTFWFVLMGKLPQKWTNLKTFWIKETFWILERPRIRQHSHMHSSTQMSHAGIIFDADSEFKVWFEFIELHSNFGPPISVKLSVKRCRRTLYNWLFLVNSPKSNIGFIWSQSLF